MKGMKEAFFDGRKRDIFKESIEGSNFFHEEMKEHFLNEGAFFHERTAGPRGNEGGIFSTREIEGEVFP